MCICVYKIICINEVKEEKREYSTLLYDYEK